MPPPIQKVTPALELTPEEIMAYIIPPPPAKLTFDDIVTPESETAKPSNSLVKNKSTLHGSLRAKLNQNGGDVESLPRRSTESNLMERTNRSEKEEEVKPPPRRSSEEKPPERPPKVCIIIILESQKEHAFNITFGSTYFNF